MDGVAELPPLPESGCSFRAVVLNQSIHERTEAFESGCPDSLATVSIGWLPLVHQVAWEPWILLEHLLADALQHNFPDRAAMTTDGNYLSGFQSAIFLYRREGWVAWVCQCGTRVRDMRNMRELFFSPQGTGWRS